MADERESGTQTPRDTSDDSVNPDLSVGLPDGKTIDIDLSPIEWVIIGIIIITIAALVY